MSATERLDAIETQSGVDRLRSAAGWPTSYDVQDQAHAVDLLAAALRAVLDLHKPFEVTLAKRDASGHKRGERIDRVCEHCAVTEDPYIAVSTDWPCPTVAAITERLGGA